VKAEKILQCKSTQLQWGTYPTSAFNRTWSKQYGFPIAHD